MYDTDAPCGCSGRGGGVYWCPLHRAAPKLLSILEGMHTAHQGWYGDDMHDYLSCDYGCNARPKQGSVDPKHEPTCLYEQARAEIAAAKGSPAKGTGN